MAKSSKKVSAGAGQADNKGSLYKAKVVKLIAKAEMGIAAGRIWPAQDSLKEFTKRKPNTANPQESFS
jgi:hypothetical protein